MPLPVPTTPGPVAFRDRPGADAFGELAQVLAPRAQQGQVTLVYASTAIVHHAPAPAALPAPRWHAFPFRPRHRYRRDRPRRVRLARLRLRLPPVSETRALASLGFLLCGWSTLAAAVTGGNPAAIAATLAPLTGTAVSAAGIYRGRP